MNYCPQCGHPLSPNQKFCPECGCDLSAQSELAKEYDTVCPDCGKVFKEIIPASCPNCGCPSTLFRREKKECDKKNDDGINVKRTLIAILFIGVLCGFGYFCYSLIQTYTYSNNNTSSGSSYQSNTTETVYSGSNGTKVIICDDGIAYINGRKGSWTQSYVRLGYDSHEFIKIRQNGMVSEGGIFRGKFYYGRSSERAIQENYPDGEPVSASRR